MIPSRHFVLGLSLFLFSGALFADSSKDFESVASPLLVIWENPHYPGPNDADFLGGPIAIVWADGRIIRTVDNKQVGHSYNEAHIPDKEFKEFLAFLSSPGVTGTRDVFTVAIDGPSRSFVLQVANKKHKWIWGVPEKQPLLDEIESRVWRLPLENSKSVDAKDIDLARFNPNKS